MLPFHEKIRKRIFSLDGLWGEVWAPAEIFVGGLSLIKAPHKVKNGPHMMKKASISRRAKLGQIQGGGVAEGHPRFDKGGVAIIFLLFTR